MIYSLRSIIHSSWLRKESVICIIHKFLIYFPLLEGFQDQLNIEILRRCCLQIHLRKQEIRYIFPLFNFVTNNLWYPVIEAQ